MRRRSVSVTGATGFVGWHLTAALMRDGWQVRAVVRRGNRKAVPDGAEVVEADLTEASLLRAVDGTDVLIHSAALIRARDEATFDAVNVAGARAAAAAAAHAGARLVLISSQAAGGVGTPDAPRTETDPPAPVNTYGRSKLASEQAVRQIEGLSWVILRPCAVYGPRDAGFLPLFRMARRGVFLTPTGADPPLTLIYIHDLVQAIALAASSHRAVGETFFVGHPSPRKASDVLQAIAAAEQRTYRPIRIPASAFGAMARVGDLIWKIGGTPLVDSSRLVELRAKGFVCSVEHIREVLGFRAETGLEDGIAQTAKWYRDAGWT